MRRTYPQRTEVEIAKDPYYPSEFGDRDQRHLIRSVIRFRMGINEGGCIYYPTEDRAELIEKAKEMMAFYLGDGKRTPVTCFAICIGKYGWLGSDETAVYCVKPWDSLEPKVSTLAEFEKDYVEMLIEANPSKADWLRRNYEESLAEGVRLDALASIVPVVCETSS